MPAYVVVDVASTDADRARRYRELAGASVARHGGRFLARGEEIHVLEGEWRPARLVVVEFPTVQQAKDWYSSPDYQEARAVREGAGRWQMVVIEGLED